MTVTVKQLVVVNQHPTVHYDEEYNDDEGKEGKAQHSIVYTVYDFSSSLDQFVNNKYAIEVGIQNTRIETSMTSFDTKPSFT